MYTRTKLKHVVHNRVLFTISLSATHESIMHIILQTMLTIWYYSACT